MKTYTDEEINGLIDELRQELPAILKAEAHVKAEELAKMEAAKEGGNGTKPVAAGGMKKEEHSMDKDEAPVAKDADDESSPSKSPPQASAPADDSATASPPPAAPADPAAAPPADPAADPAAQGPADVQSLQEAYSQLSPEDLRAHYEALKMVISQQMAPQQDAGAGMLDGPPPASPSPSPSAPPMGKQAPGMGTPMMRSEATVKAEDLAKTEKVAELEKQVEGLAKILETILTKPVQKSVTSMAEFMAKSELDKPAPAKLSRDEVKAKLSKAACSPTLAKSDRDLINRFVLNGDVNVKEIEHLLK